MSVRRAGPRTLTVSTAARADRDVAGLSARAVRLGAPFAGGSAARNGRATCHLPGVCAREIRGCVGVGVARVAGL